MTGLDCDMNCKECRSSVCHGGEVLMPERFEAADLGKTDKGISIIVDELVEAEDIANTMDLAKRVFLCCEAPDQTPEGIRFFTDKLADPLYRETLRIYGAFVNDILVGMAATRSSGTYLALLYVEASFQHRGIGRALVRQVLHDDPLGELGVHSAPGAEGFYAGLGFRKTHELTEIDGVRLIPMTYFRKKKIDQ